MKTFGSLRKEMVDKGMELVYSKILIVSFEIDKLHRIDMGLFYGKIIDL